MHAFEGRLQRLDLVDLAAEIGIAAVEVEAVLVCELAARHRGGYLAELQAEARDDLVAIGERLVKMKPRVQEHDRHPRGERRQHVCEHDAVVLKGAGKDARPA